MSAIDDALSCGDLHLWERYTEKEPLPDGVVATLQAPMPDGKPCQAKFSGMKPLAMVNEWFNYVRSEYNARTAEQEAAALKRTEAPRTGGDEARTDAGIIVPSRVAVTPDLPVSEGTVEETLQSQVATLGGLIARYDRD